MLAACSSVPLDYPAAGVPVSARAPAVSAPSPAQPASGNTTVQSKSRWTTVAWGELPGFEEDNLFEAWNAWIKSCERPAPLFAGYCGDVRRLSIATGDEQRDWMRQHFQPQRVESQQGDPIGRLTGYYEPQFDARRVKTAAYSVPIYQVPRDLAQRKPWFNRREIDTLPEVQAALSDRVIAYVADPVDAMVMQIQGSGRLRIMEEDGSSKLVRMAYGGNNGHSYRGLGNWLLDQGLIKDASWPGIKAWLAQNPQRQQELLWSNPRVVFFKEEPLGDLDASFGPKGAQGVALTPGRSIAVDASSNIPYGTPVWLVSNGTQTKLQRLVLAQDTGSAIVGPVRADYFTGWGAQAQELAGRLRQPLQMWVIWPK
jgi:membrane-bound lytic murein transglycosylase A